MAAFIPLLLEKCFQTYEEALRNQKDKSVTASFFLELYALLGEETVKKALHLLDNNAITYYYPSHKRTAVIEISSRHKNLLKYHLLLANINYCDCEFFAENVIKLGSFYTCDHILAARLAKLLCPENLRETVYPDQKFNNLLCQMQLYDKGILKNRKMLTQSQYSDWKFVGRIHEVKTLYTGIKALTFGNLNGSFHISEEGFRCTVETDSTMQASLFVMNSCFDEYHVIDTVKFSVNMNVLVECLSIFHGIECGLKMFYKGDGASLILVLEPFEEDNLTTECAIRTTQHEEPIDYSLDENSSSLNVVFIRGPDIANIFNEMDKSAQSLEILLSPRSPHFKISALGVMQSGISVQVAKTSNSIIMFNCRETTTARYRNSQMRMMKAALQTASKVAMKTDSNGLLEMHFMLMSTDQSEVYLQFFITPLTDID